MKKALTPLSLFIGACAIGLTGCGGGSSGSESKPITDNSTSSSTSSHSNSSSSTSSAASNVDYSPVAGLYDASITNDNIKDESYLYINNAGKITAYNYMGDSKDLGQNCYKEASGTEINAVITGQTLTYSAAHLHFSATTTNGKTIDWKLDDNKNVFRITYEGSISASKLALTIAGIPLSIDSKKTTTPSITDITASLCN